MPGYFTSRNSSNGLLILAALSGIALLIYTYLKKQTSINTVQTILKTLQGAVTDEIARYAVAQAAFETANFTSDIFKENNNCFGYGYIGQDIALGEKNGYAYYDSIEKSVIDWASWYRVNRKNIFSTPLLVNSLKSFVSFLKNQDYFESDEEEYYQGCLRYYNEYFPIT